MTTPRRLTPLPPLPTPPPRTDPRPPQPQAPPPSESDGNSALMASAAADSNADNSGSDIDVSGAPDDAANALYGKAADGEKDGGGILQTAAADDSSNDAVSDMMNAENSTHGELAAFEDANREEDVDLITGEQPSRKPPGAALADIVRKIRARTEPQAKPEPQDTDTDGDGEPDRLDDDDDSDGIPDVDDTVPRDYDLDGRNDDEPAPTRGPVDLSNIPPAQSSPALANIGQGSRVSSREMVDPRYRSSAANDLSLPRKTGRGKAARREALRVNRGTGRSPR